MRVASIPSRIEQWTFILLKLNLSPLILSTFELFKDEVWKFLKIRQIFNIYYCFWLYPQLNQDKNMYFVVTEVCFEKEIR